MGREVGKNTIITYFSVRHVLVAGIGTCTRLMPSEPTCVISRVKAIRKKQRHAMQLRLPYFQPHALVVAVRLRNGSRAKGVCNEPRDHVS